MILPIRTVSESNGREHWAKKAKRVKCHRTAAHLAVFATAARGRTLPVNVTLTRIAPRALDDDNLRGALKAVRDGVSDALGVDDRDPRVTWLYSQKRGRAREYAVAIDIVRSQVGAHAETES
jgi:hypothetical protein